MSVLQSRGGCACAGPYAQHLLGVDDQTTDEFEKVLLVDRSVKFCIFSVTSFVFDNAVKTFNS